jgi:ABC-type multidrug transport system ATPase subunit
MLTLFISLLKDNHRANFFEIESTYVSELIAEIRIRIRLKNNDGTVTFRDLSEGEQQLLTVLGLLRFTAENESLFLLDEPDTHLNPRWAVDYLQYLKDFAAPEKDNTCYSHVVLTTHNPLSIAELKKEQVRILKRDKTNLKISAHKPAEDPRGLGYAGIVTSDMFGIATSLDKSTYELLEQQRAYGVRDNLTGRQKKELDEINSKLDRLGFRFSLPDDEYSRYLRLRNAALTKRFSCDKPDELAGKASSMTREEKETLASSLVNEIIKEDLADREQKNEIH